MRHTEGRLSGSVHPMSETVLTLIRDTQRDAKWVCTPYVRDCTDIDVRHTEGRLSGSVHPMSETVLTLIRDTQRAV